MSNQKSRIVIGALLAAAVALAGLGTVVAHTSTQGNLSCSPANALGSFSNGQALCTEIGAVVASTGELADGSAQFTYVAASSASAAGKPVAGRGATFQIPLQGIWTSTFNADAGGAANGVAAGYGACGSSCGKRALQGAPSSSDCATIASAGRILGANPVTGDAGCANAGIAGTAVASSYLLWAGSDSPLSASEIGKINKLFPGAVPLHFPVAVGTVTVVYNLPGFGVGDIKLTGELIQRMYLGEITTWGHADLVAINPALAGNPTPIVPVHRADGSGTTFAFTDFLARSASFGWSAKDDFTTGNNAATETCSKSGGSVPAGRTLAAATQCGNGNPRVAARVAATAGAFGYVELDQAIASGLAYARVQNADKTNFALPSPATGTAAVAGAEPRIPDAWGNWTTVSISYAPGFDAYPASTFTYVITYANPGQYAGLAAQWSADEYAAFKQYLRWVLTAGQALTVDVSAAPVGATVQGKMLYAIDNVMTYGRAAIATIADVDAQGFPLVGQKVNVKGTGTAAAALSSAVFGVHNAEYESSTGQEIADGVQNGRYVTVANALVSATLPDATGGYTILAVDGEGALFQASLPAEIAAFAGVPDVGSGVTLSGQAIGATLLVRDYSVATSVAPMPMPGL